MSIVVAAHDAKVGCVWLGCNSKSQIGSLRTPGSESKWFIEGHWACALTGAALHSDLLVGSRDKFPAKSNDRIEVLKFLLQLFDDFDIGETDKESKDYGVSGLLVHADGRIWDFDTRLALTPIPSGEVWCRGSGMELAQGAASVLQEQDVAMEHCVKKAVETAIKYDCDCPGEVLVVAFHLACEEQAPHA